MATADEHRLVTAARAGDEAAFGRLAAYHGRGLEVLCLLMLGCPDRAHEAVCETLLRGWRTLDCIPPSTSLRTWLYRLATNVCLEDLDAADESPRRRPLDGVRDPGERSP
jgi:RNA polymerase sigma-70 factor, ECF subfamily